MFDVLNVNMKNARMSEFQKKSILKLELRKYLTRTRLSLEYYSREIHSSIS